MSKILKPELTDQTKNPSYINSFKQAWIVVILWLFHLMYFLFLANNQALVQFFR